MSQSSESAWERHLDEPGATVDLGSALSALVLLRDWANATRIQEKRPSGATINLRGSLAIVCAALICTEQHQIQTRSVCTIETVARDRASRPHRRTEYLQLQRIQCIGDEQRNVSVRSECDTLHIHSPPPSDSEHLVGWASAYADELSNARLRRRSTVLLR